MTRPLDDLREQMRAVARRDAAPPPRTDLDLVFHFAASSTDPTVRQAIRRLAVAVRLAHGGEIAVAEQQEVERRAAAEREAQAWLAAQSVSFRF